MAAQRILTAVAALTLAACGGHQPASTSVTPLPELPTLTVQPERSARERV